MAGVRRRWASHLISAALEADLWRKKVSYACQILLARKALFVAGEQENEGEDEDEKRTKAE